MPESAARVRLREAREKAAAEREATTVSLACGDETDELVWAAYRELQRTDREFPVQTLTLVYDVVAAVLAPHERQVREQVASELEWQAHQAAVADVDGAECIEARTWTAAANVARGPR
jgi:hypothetical protein